MNNPDESPYNPDKDNLTFEDILEMLEEACIDEDNLESPYVPLDFNDET